MTTLFIEIFRIDKKKGSSALLFSCVILIFASATKFSGNNKNNSYTEYYDDEDDDNDKNAAANAQNSASAENLDHDVSYESNDKFTNSMAADDDQQHEIPRRVPVKVKIHGDLATPAPDSNIELHFVPKQTYYQVRRYDTEQHLPRSAALAEAQNAEELLNAPRLREVISHKKTQEVYEEQGYEDGAYDHGGYTKAGEHHEINKIPGEQKIDYSRVADRSTDEADIIKIGRSDNFTTAQSSHIEQPQRSSNARETATKERNRNRKPKIRASFSRQKEVTATRKEKHIDDVDHAQQNNASRPQEQRKSGASLTRRRRIKANSTNTGANNAAKKTPAGHSETAADTKMGEESKVHATLESINGPQNELVQPTTYRPPVPAKFLLQLRSKQKERPSLPHSDGQLKDTTLREYGIAKMPALVDSSGYKFENPFENLRHFGGVKIPSDSFPYEYKSPKKTPRPLNTPREKDSFSNPTLPLSAYLYRDYKIKFKPNLQSESSEPNKMIYSLAPPPPPPPPPLPPPPSRESLLKSKFDKNAKTKFRGKVKSFPYEIVDSTKMATDEKKKFVKRNKSKDFPYQIVENVDDDNNQNSNVVAVGPQKFSLAKNEKSSAFEYLATQKPRSETRQQNENQIQNQKHAFEAVDDSPWIPMTPKEVYDIHGYDRKSAAPSEIKVKESEHSAETIKRKKEPRMPPIRVLDQPKRPPTISTSYSIQHVYPKPAFKPKLPHNTLETSFPPAAFFGKQAQHDFKTSMYHFEFPDTAESAKWKQFDTTPAVELLPSVQLGNNQRSTVSAGWPNGLTASYLDSKAFANFEGAAFADDHESVEDSKDIDTLSSNRYTVFQPLNYTSPMQLESTTSVDKLFLTPSEKLLFRHPHLSRETSHLDYVTPPEELANATLISTPKRDLIFTNVKTTNKTNNYNFEYFLPRNSSEFGLAKVSKRNDVKPDKIVVYPVDYTSSASFVEKLTLAHYSDAENTVSVAVPVLARKPLSFNYRDRINTLTSHLQNTTGSGVRRKRDLLDANNFNEDQRSNEELMSIYLDGTTTEIAVDTDKYPYYSSVPLDGLTKYSVLRYISNPKHIPRKSSASGRMTFYESTNHIRCPEPSPPQNIVPRRQNGEWAYDTRPKNPRIRNLGDSILCLKMKFFGSDPLDNPFFKEDSIGFPRIFSKKDGHDHTSSETQAQKKSAKKRAKKNIHAAVLGSHLDDTSSRQSFVREWIDSLAQPFTYSSTTASSSYSPSSYSSEKFVRKRSAKIGADHDGRKIVHKVHLAGGFINIINNSSKNSSNLKHSSPTSNLDVGKNSSSSEAPKIYQNDSAIAQFTDFPRLRIAYGLRTMGKFLTRADRIATTATTISDSGVNGVHNSTTTEPYVDQTSPTPVQKSTLKSRKKVYVDASSSLRTRQTSDYAANSTNVSATKFKHEYKEPTWRTKKHEPEKTSQNKLSTLPNSEIDSLLYVIHPKTGQGKWMKILKIEELRDNSSSIDVAVPSLIRSVESSHKNDTDADAGHQSDFTFTRKRNDTRTPCQGQRTDHQQIIKNENFPEYDVYHISGLLKQVAPLKASQVEINNLQTKEEQADDFSGDNDEANSFYDFEDEFIGTYASSTSPTKFPQPHERLYYYVVDDDDDASIL